jgi:hypothetical protein
MPITIVEGDHMKRALIAMMVMAGLLASSTVFAGAETRCVAYGNADALVPCIKYVTRGRAASTAGMNPSNAQLYTILASQPTVVPMSYGPYASYPVQQNTALQAVSTLGMVSANIMSAAAWAYDWRHGYVGSRGLYGASYMMNYPW